MCISPIGHVTKLLTGGGRLAMVNAMGGHFASTVAATRLQQRRGKRLQVVPVDVPLPEIVTRLNQFRPALLASYASMGALLAGEQEAGRLRIGAALVVLSMERVLQPYGYQLSVENSRSKQSCWNRFGSTRR